MGLVVWDLLKLKFAANILYGQEEEAAVTATDLQPKCTVKSNSCKTEPRDCLTTKWSRGGVTAFCFHHPALFPHIYRMNL